MAIFRSWAGKKHPHAPITHTTGMALPRARQGNHSTLADAQLQTSRRWCVHSVTPYMSGRRYDLQRAQCLGFLRSSVVAKTRDRQAFGAAKTSIHTSNEKKKKQQDACLSRSFATALRFGTRPTSELEQCNSPGRVFALMGTHHDVGLCEAQAWSRPIV